MNDNCQDPQVLYHAITSLIKFGSFKEALDLTLYLSFSPNGFNFPIYKIFKQLYGKDHDCKNYKTIFESLSDCNGLNYSYRTILMSMFQLEGSCGHVKDVSSAIDILESMTDFSNALSILGFIHYKGWNDSSLENSIPINLEKAKEYFEQAAFKGNSFGFWFLSEIYSRTRRIETKSNSLSSTTTDTTTTTTTTDTTTTTSSGSGAVGASTTVDGGVGAVSGESKNNEKYEWAISKALEMKNPIALYDEAVSCKDSKTLDQLNKLFGISRKNRNQINLFDYLC